MKLKEIAKIVSGTLVGDGDLSVMEVSTLEEAKSGQLAFVLDEKALPQALSSKASAFILPSRAEIKGKPVISVKNPRLAMAQILPFFSPKKKFVNKIHPTAVISKSAKIGKRVTIYPFVFIGEDCEIGEDSVLHPSVTLYDRVKIGKRVIIHSGARLGVDGFGFVPVDEKFVKIPQIGTVVVEDDVEIFANACVSCGTIGPTIIGKGTKIDNITHIAHNCKIGKNCAIVSLVGFGGSVTMEDHVTVGGQAGFAGHITIGKNSTILARGGVTKDLPPNSFVSGFPAQDHRQELALQAAMRRLAKKNKG